MIELREHLPETPIVLAGCKSDLRGGGKSCDETGSGLNKWRSFDEGVDLADRIGANVYLECSSLT